MLFFDILLMHAGVVQWLVYGLAKAAMGVRSSSLAPLKNQMPILRHFLCA
jgi:hypothetical protein